MTRPTAYKQETQQMFTAERIAELRRIGEAATEPPWNNVVNRRDVRDDFGRQVCALHDRGVGYGGECFRDGDFIATARNEWPALLDELERLRADAERYRWLRRSVSNPAYPAVSTVWGVRMIGMDSLDAAIDAARATAAAERG